MRKTYEVGGQAYLCRVPDVSDHWALTGTLPILPSVDPKQTEAAIEAAATDPKKLLTALARADMFLMRCMIVPKPLAESPAEIPEGFVALPEIDALERLELFYRLMQDFGFTKEAAKRIGPLSETVVGSAPSTPSASDTAETLPIA